MGSFGCQQIQCSNKPWNNEGEKLQIAKLRWTSSVNNVADATCWQVATSVTEALVQSAWLVHVTEVCNRKQTHTYNIGRDLSLSSSAPTAWKDLPSQLRHSDWAVDTSDILFLVLAYLGRPGQRAVKRVSLLLLLHVSVLERSQESGSG